MDQTLVTGEPLTEKSPDDLIFGKDAMIYCASHMRPHTTGWCTVSVEDKILLDADSLDEAYRECEAKGLKIYNPD